MRPASLAVSAGLAMAMSCAEAVEAAGRHAGRAARATAAGLEAHGTETWQAAQIGSLSSQHAAAQQQVAILTRQFAASVAALRGPQPAPPGGFPLSPSSAADATLAAASLRVLAGAAALRLARLQDSVRRADALSAALEKERTAAATLRDAELAQAGAIEQTPGVARRPAGPAESQMRAAAGRAATEASHQPTLREAIVALNKAPGLGRLGRQAGIAGGGRAGRAGSARAPVAGPLVQRYGQITESGPASGVSYAPPPAALVSSPCRGRVDFAGPFRSYGKMVIVDCGRGYRFVLAGLDRVDAVPGTAVGAGAPVGRMPDFTPGGPDRPTLYVQLRHGSDTVDPAKGAGR